MRVAFFILLLLKSLVGTTQTDTARTRALAASVLLDSVVISASQQGFDVEDFVGIVQNDESLRTAFSNLKRASCEFSTEMSFFNKKGKEIAGLTGYYEQVFEDQCRELVIRDEDFRGNYLKGKKEKRKYYTARLYERVFIPDGVECFDKEILNAKQGDAMSGQIEELKKLIFKPGSHANVPLIGRKTEIFSEDMAEYYDFLISGDTLKGKEVYVFEARVKPEFVDRERKTVLKSMTTLFERSTLQILERNYQLAHKTALYMFDVTMAVELDIFDGLYFPTYIRYSGEWNIPIRKREIGVFEVYFDNISIR